MTPDEILAIVRRLIAGEVDIDSVRALDVSQQDKNTIFQMALYEIWESRARPRRRRAQRRALSLLRGLLTAEQQAMLRRSRCILVIGSLGNTYRLFPEAGGADRVVRHGKRLFAEQHYCLHSPENELPPADTTLAHLLLLTADEPAFLAMANSRACNDMLWNGAWLRRVRTARVAREAAAREASHA